MNVKLIALDLDGTLLTSKKTLSPRNRAALDAAAARGIFIVPTTGRLYAGLPEFIRTLPYLRYVITVNGGQVEDRGEILHTAYLPLSTALQIYALLDRLDAPYDCYLDGRAYMPRNYYEKIGDYIRGDAHSLELVRRLREPKDDFLGYLRAAGRPLQKLQFFLKDPSVRPALIAQLSRQFPNTSITYSGPQNVEINAKDGVKGEGLRVLCRHIGIPLSETVAFGDSVNDVTMLEAAGTGVAMRNSDPAAFAAADVVTASNDEDGVALYLEQNVL